MVLVILEISKSSETQTHAWSSNRPFTCVSLYKNLARVVLPTPPIPTMGKTLKFSLHGSSCNSLLSNFSFSVSRPMTSDSSKEVSFPILLFFGFSPFTIKPGFCFSRCCNLVVILSNLGLSL
ncbi:hypothetical protein Hanom_Chr04g00284541 [Helianthus anomalus]